MSRTPRRSRSTVRAASELDYAGSERLTMNMGPQHPSAHGVFRAILTLEGETVVGVDAVIGYLHRCHEKLSETLTYAQYPSIASKTDYVAAMTSEFAYVMAAEQIGKIEVPKRAQYLRVHRAGAAARRLAPALARHLVHGHGRRARRRRDDLPLLHPRARARSSICSSRSSARGCSTASTRSAACATTCPPGGPRSAARRSISIDSRIGEYEQMLEDNPFFLARAQGVGVHLARAGRGRRHLRSAAARLGRQLRPAPRRAVFLLRGLPVRGAGGNRGRLLRALPRADGRVPRVDQDRPPGARRAARGADLVAARPEVGRADRASRRARPTPASKAPRGEVGCYLIADGSAKPYRMKWRGASFSNLAVLPHIIPGHKVADVVAIMGSVDPVFGEVDR